MIDDLEGSASQLCRHMRSLLPVDGPRGGGTGLDVLLNDEHDRREGDEA